MKLKQFALQRKRVNGRVRRKRSTQSRGTSSHCLTAPIVLVAVALLVTILFPAKTKELMSSVAAFMGRDAAFGEALSSFGRAISGEKSVGDSLQDAYTAVFNPSAVSTGNNVQKTEEIEQQEKKGPEVGLLPLLPENASLEQRNLGFEYTTPVSGVFTSPFGWRTLTGEETASFHYGIDIAAEKGTEIYAFADGEVFAVGDSSTLGKYIILHHAGGYSTLYAHCSEILVSGGTVAVGELIARVGDTGAATGPHLHFELQNGTLYLNPIYYVSIW